MKGRLSQLLPRSWRAAARERYGAYFYGSRSYSQEGEDLVLRRLFDRTPTGIYLDVGAHHPFRFSNTCLLHQRGWRGINIDPRPGSMTLFEKFRPRDINLEIGVARARGKMKYFMFKEPAYNTFDVQQVSDQRKSGREPMSTVEVECVPLSQILDQHLGRLGSDPLDLLTVDAEGLDLDVLQSNDWTRFRPRAVVVEILGTDVSGACDSPIGRYCSSVGYELFAKLHHSAVFLRR
jgi:FkbM family methyltransferase